jgi:hypothetical protein
MAVMSRPWQSYAPAAVDALVAYLTSAANAIPGLVIKDGPWVTGESEGNVVCIGWAGFPIGVTRPATQMQQELGGADVTSQGIQEGLAPSIREHLAIACASVSRDGANNMSNARKTAYANVAVVGQLLSPSQIGQHIGGIAMVTMGTVVGLHQDLDRRGALAIVTFTIEGQAYAQQ